MIFQSEHSSFRLQLPYFDFLTLIEDAHGIGKRRDAKTPPTMSQLSVVAYSVIQLLLEPHSATLYYENKKVHPPNLQQVQIKYGLIEGMILLVNLKIKLFLKIEIINHF